MLRAPALSFRSGLETSPPAKNPSDMTVHLFGRTASDARTRHLWELLTVSRGDDVVPAVTASYSVDRRGPRVSFSIPPMRSSAEGDRPLGNAAR